MCRQCGGKRLTGELNFVSENLDELDAALEADNIVARFKNPDPEKDPIDFEMRPMTPGETATLLSNAIRAYILGSCSRRKSEP